MNTFRRATHNATVLVQALPVGDQDAAATWEVAEIEEPERPDSEPVEDSIQLYLHEIGQVALLKVEEERNLAILIHRGKIARQSLANATDNTRRERLALEPEVARGEEARR